MNPLVVTIVASSGVSGENPTGTVSFHFGGGGGPTRSGEVSCLSVRANTAILGFGEGYYHDLGENHWVTGLVRVVDNGPGPGDTFEYVELERGPPAPPFEPPPGDPLPGPTECSTFPPDQQVYVLDPLDDPEVFRINDALPLRASKD